MGRITDGLVNYQPATSTEDITTKTTPEGTDKALDAPQEIPQTQTNNRAASDSSTKVAEHSFNGQMQAAKLHAQIHHKPQVAEANISQPAPKDAQKTAKAPTMKEVMTNSGMKNVHERPTDAELKTYYSTNAPAHDMISKGDYKNAAAEYRKLADTAKTDGEKARFNSVAKQLDVAQAMKDAKVGDLSFPPTEANLQSYFGTMKGKPMQDIKKAYEDYSNAFYVHSETKGVDKGDVKYDERTYTKDNKSYQSKAPDKWSDVSDRREMHSDGRRIIDCEGFALIGEKCFKAAGFDQVEYAVMARMDDPKTPKNESYTDQHIMITARRTIPNPDGIPAYEIGVISNGSFYSGSSYGGKSNYEQGRSQQVTNAYGDTFREFKGGKVQIPGGLVTYDGQAWISENELMDLLKNPSRPKPK